MAKVGEYDVTRHGDGLYYVTYMNYPVSPGYHGKGRARLWAKLVCDGVDPKDITMDAPGKKPPSKSKE